MTKTRPPGTPVLVEMVAFKEEPDDWWYGKERVGTALAEVRHAFNGTRGRIRWIGADQIAWVRERWASGERDILLFCEQVEWAWSRVNLSCGENRYARVPAEEQYRQLGRFAIIKRDDTLRERVYLAENGRLLRDTITADGHLRTRAVDDRAPLH